MSIGVTRRVEKELFHHPILALITATIVFLGRNCQAFGRACHPACLQFCLHRRGPRHHLPKGRRPIMNASSNSNKLESPSAQRNKQPIWQVLESKVLGPLLQQPQCRVLEIAAGSGVHMQFFCEQLLLSYENSSVDWLPVDAEDAYLASIHAYVQEIRAAEAQSVQVRDPLHLTFNEHGIEEQETRDIVFLSSWDLVICINMIHIAPWSAAIGLMQTASQLLARPHGRLVLYGPYLLNDKNPPSNLAFDASLKSRNPSWGIRRLDEVVSLAEQSGLRLLEPVVPMPANNHMLIFGHNSAPA